MRHLGIITCVILCVTAGPTRIERNEDLNKKEETVIGDGKDKTTIGETKEFFSKIVVDISERRAIDENTDDLEIEKSGEVVEQAAGEENGQPRSTIHIHTPNPPNINVMPTKYQLTGNTPVMYGAKPVQQQQTKPQSNPHKKKEEEGKPYNQVNVYVYFPNDMAGMGGSSMTVNSYSNEGSSSTSVTNAKKTIQAKPEPCPLGYARVKGVCLEIDQRRKRVL